MENKDNINNNNKHFSDNNGRNVKQSQVNQDRMKIKRCEICFGVGHDRRNCPQARDKTVIFLSLRLHFPINGEKFVFMIERYLLELCELLPPNVMTD
uniref:CCHC-type domain-containing protein n=1 Tax=Lactuca sativa TaxID=4236 RepID=A0A9R1VWI0_LACSA|nr:hypothetical protein LSAT_V11C400158080 [Lactuca sativa]